MQSEHKFGKKLFEDSSKSSQVALRRCLLLLPGIFLFALGVILLLDASLLGEGGADTRMLAILLLAAMPFYALMVCFVAKGYHGTIYEHGLVLRYGSKRIERTFQGLRSVDATKHTLTIFERGKRTGIVLLSAFVPNLRQFAEELISVYTRSLTTDLTPETLYETTIQFGNRLKLENGNFIYKKGKTIVPLDDVYEIEIQAESTSSLIAADTPFVTLRGFRGNDLLVVATMHVSNLEILHHIAYMMEQR